MNNYEEEHIKQEDKQKLVDTSTINVVSILNTVDSILNGDRLDSYGSPLESFIRISDYWTDYLSHKGITDNILKPSDAAMMMVLFKLAREENKHKEDNIVDAIAYLVLYNNLIREELE